MTPVGWLDKLGRKYGRFAIRNLMVYITALNGAVYLLSLFDYRIVLKLMLIPSLVMKGEVWRLVTFLFVPMDTSPLWMLISLYFYYMIGTALEREWGSFKFNIYYLVGVLGTIGAAFIGGLGSAAFLNYSLIFAFSYLYPDFEILMFFFIPIKIKYLAILYAVYIIYNFRFAPLLGLITLGGSALNFVLFFGKDIIAGISRKQKSYRKRVEFNAKKPKIVVIHRCTVCGRTEWDDKNLEFRYCVDCDGDYEYCMDHLYTHEHIKKK
jgi:hypothetical protein